MKRDTNISAPVCIEENASELDELLERADNRSEPRRLRASTTLVGELVDARHPVHRGRVRVRWTDADGLTYERWLPVLQGLPTREGDRVLLVRPDNWSEHVVTGVIDGFARRPELAHATAARLELQQDESIRIQSKAGHDLIEVFEIGGAPVVRLLGDDVDLEVGGRLRLRADQLELEARAGQVRVTATDDVVVLGETIHLN